MTNFAKSKTNKANVISTIVDSDATILSCQANKANVISTIVDGIKGVPTFDGANKANVISTIVDGFARLKGTWRQ